MKRWQLPPKDPHCRPGKKVRWSAVCEMWNSAAFKLYGPFATGKRLQQRSPW